MPRGHCMHSKNNQPLASRLSSRQRSPHLGTHRHLARGLRLRRVRAPAPCAASGSPAAQTSGDRHAMRGPVLRSCWSHQPSRVHPACGDNMPGECGSSRGPDVPIVRNPKWAESAAPANWPVGGGNGTEIGRKSVVSGQNSRNTPDIAPIFSFWRVLQACTAGRPVADIGPLGRPLGRPILIPAHAAVAQW